MSIREASRCCGTTCTRSRRGPSTHLSWSLGTAGCWLSYSPPHPAGKLVEVSCQVAGVLQWDFSGRRVRQPQVGRPARRDAELTFKPEFLPFADRNGSWPLGTWPGEPHEKRHVERPIHYVKNNLWHGRKFAGMEDLQG